MDDGMNAPIRDRMKPSSSERVPDSEPMGRESVGALLNELLEFERAVARLLAAYLVQLPFDSDETFLRLRRLQREEAGNCTVLIRCLRHMGIAPSPATGVFYWKGLFIPTLRDRLHFLNWAQDCVARRIAAALPRLSVSREKEVLQDMHDAHVANILLCEALIE